jgi:hypothetical protein
MCISILVGVFMILSMDVRVKCQFVCLFAVLRIFCVTQHTNKLKVYGPVLMTKLNIIIFSIIHLTFSKFISVHKVLRIFIEM